MERIYLDYAATSPHREGVWEAMRPWLSDEFGNPSSLHAEGRKAKDAIDSARETLSAALKCEFAEFLFTSSGTESCNMALVGAALAAQKSDRKTILVGSGEHHAVLHATPMLQALGFQVEQIPIDQSALVDVDWIDSHLGDHVLLVSVMHANNEVGTIQPVAEIGALCQVNGAYFHCDSVQTFGKRSISFDELNADLISVSGHKIGGPKGIGGLAIRAGTQLKPLIAGGGQEREMRAGTENAAAIAGFAHALKETLRDTGLTGRNRVLRDQLRENLQNDGFLPTLDPQIPCLDGHLHGRFPGITAESMLVRLDRSGVAASSGAACSSGSILPSHVLKAMNYSDAESKEGLRFTLGFQTTEEEIKDASQRIIWSARAIFDLRTGG